MAGDWIAIDDDLPEKAEVQMICDLTGLTVDVVLGRLLLFWRWVDRHWETKRLKRTSVTTVTRIAQGDEKFWNAVAEAGWLTIGDGWLEVPGYESRFSKSAKRRLLQQKRVQRHRDKTVTPKRYKNVTYRTEQNTDLTDHKNKRSETDQNRSEGGTGGKRRVVPSEVSHLAADLFRRTGYAGDDGGLLWQAAGAVCVGLLSEDMVIDAAQGCREVTPKPTNVLGYFRQSLRAKAASQQVDADAALTAIYFDPKCPKGVPRDGK